MSAVKLIADSTVVDAVKVPLYVVYVPRLKMFLACPEREAQGIANHNQTGYWHLEGRPEFGVDGYTTVSAVSISEDEADAIIAALDAGMAAPEPEPEPADPDGSIDLVRENTIAQMSAACNAAITGGVDVTLTDGNTYHFSLTVEDQINLISLQSLLAAGAEAVPYHADGQECRYYSPADFQLIATAATSWKIYQESYFNSLRAYIRSMETMAELLTVTYGMSIPEAYQTDVLKGLLAQMEGG